MEEWKEYKISEVIEEIAMGPFGSNIKVDNFIDFGIPVLNGSNLLGYKLNENSFNYVSEEKADSLGRANAYRGDVVITHRGTLGQIVYIPSNSKYERYVISQSQFRLKLNQALIRPDFLVYYFHTRQGQHLIMMNASQVGVPALARPTSTFKEISVPVPPMEEQNKIMDILHALDDKIAINKKICENLEAQAQALFKHWFVDFAPFKDGNFCANREQNETCFNSAEVQPKITGKACKFVESELGMIPLSLVCEQITDGVHNSVKDEPNSSYMLLSCKNIVGGVLSKNNYRSISKNTFDSLRLRTKLAKGDILISSVGTIGEIAIVEEDPLNYEFQRSVAIVKPKEKIGTYFLYNALLASKTRLQHAAHGAVQQCLFLGDLKKFKVNCYDIEKAFLYNETVKPLFEEIAKLHQESDRLASLRDTLLPKLMSGQIKVNEIERAYE